MPMGPTKGDSIEEEIELGEYQRAVATREKKVEFLAAGIRTVRADPKRKQIALRAPACFGGLANHVGARAVGQEAHHRDQRQRRSKVFHLRSLHTKTTPNTSPSIQVMELGSPPIRVIGDTEQPSQ